MIPDEPIQPVASCPVCGADEDTPKVCEECLKDLLTRYDDPIDGETVAALGRALRMEKDTYLYARSILKRGVRMTTLRASDGTWNTEPYHVSEHDCDCSSCVRPCKHIMRLRLDGGVALVRANL